MSDIIIIILLLLLLLNVHAIVMSHYSFIL